MGSSEKKRKTKKILQMSLGSKQTPVHLTLTGQEKSIQISFGKQSKLVLQGEKQIWIPPPGNTSRGVRPCCLYKSNQVLLSIPEDGKLFISRDTPLMIESRHMDHFKALVYPYSDPVNTEKSGADDFADKVRGAEAEAREFAKSLKDNYEKQCTVLRESEQILLEHEKKKKVLSKYVKSLRKNMLDINQSIKELEKQEKGKTASEVKSCETALKPRLGSREKRCESIPRSRRDSSITSTRIHPKTNKSKGTDERDAEESIVSSSSSEVVPEFETRRDSENLAALATSALAENSMGRLAKGIRKSKLLVDDVLQENEKLTSVQSVYIQGVERLYEDQQRLLEDISEALGPTNSSSSTLEEDAIEPTQQGENNNQPEELKHMNGREFFGVKYKLSSLPNMGSYSHRQNLEEKLAQANLQLKKLKKELLKVASRAEIPCSSNVGFSESAVKKTSGTILHKYTSVVGPEEQESKTETIVSERMKLPASEKDAFKIRAEMKDASKSLEESSKRISPIIREVSVKPLYLGEMDHYEEKLSVKYLDTQKPGPSKNSEKIVEVDKTDDSIKQGVRQDRIDTQAFGHLKMNQNVLNPDRKQSPSESLEFQDSLEGTPLDLKYKESSGFDIPQAVGKVFPERSNYEDEVVQERREEPEREIQESLEGPQISDSIPSFEVQAESTRLDAPEKNNIGSGRDEIEKPSFIDISNENVFTGNFRKASHPPHSEDDRHHEMLSSDSLERGGFSRTDESRHLYKNNEANLKRKRLPRTEIGMTGFRSGSIPTAENHMSTELKHIQSFPEDRLQPTVTSTSGSRNSVKTSRKDFQPPETSRIESPLKELERRILEAKVDSSNEFRPLEQCSKLSSSVGSSQHDCDSLVSGFLSLDELERLTATRSHGWLSGAQRWEKTEDQQRSECRARRQSADPLSLRRRSRREKRENGMSPKPQMPEKQMAAELNTSSNEFHPMELYTGSSSLAKSLKSDHEPQIPERQMWADYPSNEFHPMDLYTESQSLVKSSESNHEDSLISGFLSSGELRRLGAVDSPDNKPNGVRCSNGSTQKGWCTPGPYQLPILDDYRSSKTMRPRTFTKGIDRKDKCFSSEPMQQSVPWPGQNTARKTSSTAKSTVSKTMPPKLSRELFFKNGSIQNRGKHSPRNSTSNFLPLSSKSDSQEANHFKFGKTLRNRNEPALPGPTMNGFPKNSGMSRTFDSEQSASNGRTRRFEDQDGSSGSSKIKRLYEEIMK